MAAATSETLFWVALTQSKVKIRSVSDPIRILYQINTKTITSFNQNYVRKNISLPL